MNLMHFKNEFYKFLNKRNPFFFFLAISILWIIFIQFPYFYQFLEDPALQSVMSEDHGAFVANALHIIYGLGVKDFRPYMELFTRFAYGPLFWILSGFFGLPFRKVQFEPGIILSINFLSSFVWLGILIFYNRIFKLIVDRKIVGKNYFFVHFFFLMFTVVVLSRPIILGNIMEFRPEIFLSFFVIASLYFLVKDAGRLNNWFLLAVASFTLSVCVKALGAFFTLVFPLYVLINYKKLNFKKLVYSCSIIFSILFILYFPIYKAHILKHYLKELYFYSLLTRGGWSQDLFQKSIEVSVAFFDHIYINTKFLIMFLILGILSFGKGRFKGVLKNNGLEIGVWLVIVLYSIYTIFIVIRPNNYGILIVILLPALVAFLIRRVYLSRVPMAALLCVLFLSFNVYSLKNRHALNFELSPYKKKLLNSQKDLRNYFRFYFPKGIVCSDKEFRIMKVDGQYIPAKYYYEKNLISKYIKDCNTIIVWNIGRVYKMLSLKNKNPVTLVEDSKRYLSDLLNGRTDFSLTYEKENFLIFTKNGI